VLSGIALGTIVTIAGWHLARWLAPRDMAEAAMVTMGPALVLSEPGMYVEPNPYPETSEQQTGGSSDTGEPAGGRPVSPGR